MSQRKKESKRMKLDRETRRAAVVDPDDSSLSASVRGPAVMQPPVLKEAAPDEAAVASAIAAAQDWLLKQQNPEGYWCAEFEADTTLESYFIIFKWMLGHRDHPKIPKYANVILEAQLEEGGWATYHGGPPEISVSVLSYLALKLAGTPANDPRMQKACAAILKLGGAVKANTYTKYHMAFFGQYDWNHVPAIPPEMMLVPTVSPFHIYDMSSWSRTIFVSLSVIYAHKPTIDVPPERGCSELFVGGRQQANLALPKDKDTVTWRNLFLFADKGLKVAEKLPLNIARKIALKKAEQWILERMPKSGGLSAILPAMQNSMLALWCLGYKEDHPWMKYGIHELEMLEMERDENHIECQPCVSPVWDTCISVYALGQSGMDGNHPAMKQGAAWLLSKQTTEYGDWQVHNPMPPGGWYFEFLNEFYPDVDDTIMTLMALRYASGAGKLPGIPENKLPVNGVKRGFLGAEAPAKEYSEEDQRAAIERGIVWVLGMQNDDGGWASFDKGNDKEWLTKVPFADHNAMIDPSTADITSRVLECLSFHDEYHLTRCKHVADKDKVQKAQALVARAIEFIKKDQCEDGSWFGRWGVNYIYGTWQVLRGMRLIGEDMNKGYLRRGVEWFKKFQNADGGWGETIGSYDDISLKGKGESTKSQTAWALMGLISAGQGHSVAVRRGVKYLLDTIEPNGTWEEEPWTGTGFPRVFYMKYHYYRHYFPLMALAQYRAFLRGEY
ncbi:MAG TPA: terpene cyclase/mutase family protein [Planctomycetota bacterium]|nr:terpene cyclase/mutase family protein [Planctomycetota bacterium]